MEYHFVWKTIACFRIGTWQVAFELEIPLLPKISTTYPFGIYIDSGQKLIGSSQKIGLL